MIQVFKKNILSGNAISKEDAFYLINSDLTELCSAANEIREYFANNSFDICTIINGKSGKCSENCRFCAQSQHYSSQVEEYPLLDATEIIKSAKMNYKSGILRFSVVTSGRKLSDNEVDKLCESLKKLKKECPISLCTSNGLLTYNQFLKLKAVGVERYHNNLETSRRNFPNICTTHTYDDKISAIKAAKKAGLEVCSGGIMGLGETFYDRIDMAFDLRSLEISSVPINILNPINGTPLEHLKPLTEDEIRRIVAIYRFIFPKTAIRIAGGRGLLPDKGKKLFSSGANAAISGNMLTTSGICIDNDLNMLLTLGYEVKKL